MNLNKIKELMKKYDIKSVSGGAYEEGFFDCLRGIEKNNIDLFKGSHILNRIEFAKKNNLDYNWLINQLRNDWKRRTGTKEEKENAKNNNRRND